MIVQPVDVVSAALSSILRMARRVADGEDVHVEGHSQIPGHAGEVPDQFDGVADQCTQQRLVGRNERTGGGGVLIEHQQNGHCKRRVS